MQIAGSVVLITGANRGIGRAFVAGFVAAGARKIYAAARDPTNISDPRVESLRLDITDPTQVAAVAAACTDVSVLVNNAGIATFSPLLGAPSMAAARLEMETNYFGTLAMCRAFAPILTRQGGGAIVNIISGASWMTAAQLGSYSASKRAQLALTLGIRIELRAQGTLVVAVHPGWVDTDMTAHITAEKTSPEQVVTETLASLAAHEEEVVPGEMAARVKAALREDPASLEAMAQRAWDERPVPPDR
jgi:NAD(P)-dependent dehydrogenase (short-subunit alcohol dehydrogenase family)